MGKRKKSSRKPQGPKKREPLSKTFACLFCNHEKSVDVKLDKKGGIGSLQCKVCGQVFQTNINYLSQHVDVYSDWVDACDAVAEDKDDGGPATNFSQRPRGIAAGKERERGYGGDGADDGDDEALYADD